jgi:hypothetical protein
MISLNLLKGLISKYSHTGGSGFNIQILRGTKFNTNQSPQESTESEGSGEKLSDIFFFLSVFLCVRKLICSSRSFRKMYLVVVGNSN